MDKSLDFLMGLGSLGWSDDEKAQLSMAIGSSRSSDLDTCKANENKQRALNLATQISQAGFGEAKTQLQNDLLALLVIGKD